MRHFQGVTSASDVKAEFRKLAKTLHPDVGGSEEQMKQLQEDYQQALDDIGHEYTVNADDISFTAPRSNPNTYSWDEFDNAFNKAWENINRRNKQRTRTQSKQL